MDRRVYTAADITVLTFEEAVRKRTGMYFAVAPDSQALPTNILQGVIDDALHPADGGGHCTVGVEITGDLRFTVADDQPPALDGFSEPESGCYGSLFSRRRWMLAAAAALSSRTLVEIRAGGRGWRQDLTGTAPSRPVPFDAPGEASGTRATFELDAAFLAPGAIISTSVEQWPARGNGCPVCAGTSRAETLTIRDLRIRRPPAPEA
jgi:hypothetical protein